MHKPQTLTQAAAHHYQTASKPHQLQAVIQQKAKA